MKIPLISFIVDSAALVACICFVGHADGAVVSVGSASGFGVLAGTTVTNTGVTVIDGEVGVAPGTSITGFPPGTATALHSNDSVAIAAQADAAAAYANLAGQASTSNLTGTNLGGLTLFPGVYTFSSTADLTGTLTLDANGVINPSWVFQIGSAFNTADTNASIITIGGADPSQVYFQVGSAATIGTGGSIVGTIIALDSVTLKTGASLLGRAIALTGAVTLDTNVIVVPEPSSSLLLLSGMIPLLAFRKRTTRA